MTDYIAVNCLDIDQEAKALALEMINDFNIQNTKGELAFWLNIPVTSDFVALAVYINDMMHQKKAVEKESLFDELIKKVPYGFFKLRLPNTTVHGLPIF